MGIDANGARFLLDAARNGVVFSQCAMFGRQEMHISKSRLCSAFLKTGHVIRMDEAETILENGGCKGYAESFLKKCGADAIVSFDNSDYEGATVIHNMNQVIPAVYEGCFDVVIDSGTLEHIFNVPVALKNAMNMVKEGGHFLAITPCNNFMGHGFYQFSPELFFSVFSEQNGFQVERMFIYESRPDAQWYKVADPAKLGGRVELVNSCMTYLLVQARKLSMGRLEQITPQQSDYVKMWDTMIPASAGMGSESLQKQYAAFKGQLKGTLRKIRALIPLEPLRSPFRKPWYEPYH